MSVKATTPAEPLLDTPAVAEQLGVSVSAVRKMIHQRRIPFLKVGKLVRFRRSEIEAWLDERATGVGEW